MNPRRTVIAIAFVALAALALIPLFCTSTATGDPAQRALNQYLAALDTDPTSPPPRNVTITTTRSGATIAVATGRDNVCWAVQLTPATIPPVTAPKKVCD